MTERLSMGPGRVHAKSQRLLQLIWCLWVVFGRTRTGFSVYPWSPTSRRSASAANSQSGLETPRRRFSVCYGHGAIMQQ